MVTLADKYAILGQHAQADLMRAQAEQQRAAAGASYDRARTGLLNPQFEQDKALNQANISHLGAQNALMGMQGQNLGSEMRYRDGPQTQNLDSEMRYRDGPQTQSTIAGTRKTGAEADLLETTNNWMKKRGASSSPSLGAPFGGNVGSVSPGFKRGMARVPGKGSPKKDTVPAKLAPGEAVLNAPAAEMAGRGNIAALNRKGAGMMGMKPGPGNMPGHYATGTPMVEGPPNSMPMAGHQLPDLNIQSDYQPLPVDFAPAGYTEGSMGPTPHAPSPLFGAFSPAGYTPGSMGVTPRAFSPAGYTPGSMHANRPPPFRPSNPSPGYTPGSMPDQRPPIMPSPPSSGYTGGSMGPSMRNASPINNGAPGAGYTPGGGMRPPPIREGNPSPGYTPGHMAEQRAPVRMLDYRPEQPYPAGAPQGRSIADIESQVAHGGAAFTPQRSGPAGPIGAPPGWQVGSGGAGPQTMPSARSEIAFDQGMRFPDEGLRPAPSRQPAGPPMPANIMSAPGGLPGGLSPIPAGGFLLQAQPAAGAPLPTMAQAGGGRGMMGGSIPSNGFQNAPRPDLGAERARAGSFGEAFAAARKTAGGAGGMFSYGGKDYQTNVKGEAYKPAGQLRRV